ncbi:MAG TPA: hypothetical protein VGY99_28965, partial [Candidatus Binataceae bacterium]|nr:hypothetical protein [Candidatus Binataceae bacterium]
VVVGIGMRHDAEQQHCGQAKAFHVRSPSVRPAAAILRRAGRARGFRWFLLQVGKLDRLELDPEKWTPVFRKDHAQTES